MCWADVLRQLVRECEELKATERLSPLLSSPGGHKRGVLLSPSRSCSPIHSDGVPASNGVLAG